MVKVLIFVIGFIIGVLMQQIIVTMHKPKNLGNLKIIYDPDEPNPHIFMELKYHPDNIPNRVEALVKVIKLYPKGS